MASSKCPECGGSVSAATPTCPLCGCQLAPSSAQPSVLTPLPPRREPDAEAAGQTPTAAANPSFQPPQDFDDQLRKLAKLKDEGVLTEEDCNTRKRALLGLDTPASLTPAPSPTAPSTGNVGKGCMGCLGLIVLLMLLGWIGEMAGCNGGGGTGQATESAKPTKAEWKAKFGEKFGFSAKMGIVENLKPDQFKSVMGAPDRTQTIGDDAFWYYECSDGMIQLELYAPNLVVFMQGKVNDF